MAIVRAILLAITLVVADGETITHKSLTVTTMPKFCEDYPHSTGCKDDQPQNLPTDLPVISDNNSASAEPKFDPKYSEFFFNQGRPQGLEPERRRYDANKYKIAGDSLCRVTEKLNFMAHGIDSNGTRREIVQGTKNRQGVLHTRCTDIGQPCQHCPGTKCVQKTHYVRLLVWKDRRSSEKEPAYILVPSGCSCMRAKPGNN